MNSMYMGQYSHSIDAKGRLIIPSRFRDQLGEKFNIIKGYDACLYAMDQETYQARFAEICALPDSLPDARAIKRYFFQGSMEAEYDKQGRVLVSQELRSHAGLVKDVVLVGAGDKVEIWSAENYESAVPDNIEEIAGRLNELGYKI